MITVRKRKDTAQLFFLFSLHVNLAYIAFVFLTPANPVVQTVIQYSVQVINLLTLLAGLRTAGASRLLVTLRPVLLLMAAGLAASILGFNPAASLLTYMRWVFCLTAGVAIGLSCDIRTIEKWVFWYVFAGIMLSIVFALALPSIGTQYYGGTPVWRGIFPQKNALGWFAVLSFVVAVALGRQQAWWIRGLLLLASMLTLIKSGNAGGLGVMMGVAAFYVSITFLIRRAQVPPVELILIQILIVGGCVVVGGMVMEYVANALHRDLTFTGRTNIWAIYFEAEKEHWLLGRGPGAYSSDSSITQTLGQNSAFQDQFIRTPHNNILGFFGDSGIVGVAAYIGMMFYFTFIRPAFTRNFHSIGCATFAVAILLGGLLETHEVFSNGMSVFLLFLVYGMSLQKPRPDRSPAREPEPAEPAPAALPAAT